jgi:hypothetical protein
LTPVSFDKHLTTAGIPEDLVVLPAGMTGVSVALWVLTTNARIAFDAIAGPTGLRIATGGTYQQDGITVRDKLSFLGDPGGKPRIYGVIWCTRGT